MDESVKREILNEYQIGDMIAIYYLAPSNGQVEFVLVPSSRRQDLQEFKFSRGDSFVHCKLVGDHYSGGYAGGVTMQNSGTIEAHFRFDHQKTESKGDTFCVHTYLKDERNYVLVHHMVYRQGEYSVRLFSTFENHGSENAVLEDLTSFCFNELTPFVKGDASGCLKLHRILSKWSAEGRLRTDTIEDLQLEPSWSNWSSHSERFGQVGSMPVKKYFPFAAVEDSQNSIFWGAQLGIESSWQMQAFRRDHALSLSGGIADREFGHWMKTVKPGESFSTPWAILSVCDTTLDMLCQRLTWALQKTVNNGPASEQSLPVLFNEYCTTWGLPSHENIVEIVDTVKDKGLDYFVIDCGWFVKEGKPWDISMGDYVPSDRLFPTGLGTTSSYIKNAGMKPGIWFEIDNVGRLADAYQDEEHLLKRDGVTLTTANRRFWDMRQNWVIDHLTEKVIGQLKKYNFEYMKMDYNDTIGLGCDDADSLGEGLRQNMEASVHFVEKVKAEIPDIILENCASGGHKLEPLMMSLCSMASFSDAHECEEIPVIALNLHRTILPRQSQIWAVIRKEADLKRIAYIMSSTFLGRMCLSGDVTHLTPEQWNVIERAITFYKAIAPAIYCGQTFFHSHKGSSTRHLTGYQGLVRMQCSEAERRSMKMGFTGTTHDSAYVTIHTFHGDYPDDICIPLPDGCPEQIALSYSDTDISKDVYIEDHILHYHTSEDMKAVSVYLI